MKNKRKFKKRTLWYSLMFLLMFFISTGIINALTNVTSLNKLKNKLESDLSVIEEKKVDLENEITKLEDEEYVARYAREKYLFSKKGEYIIKIQK